MYLRKSLKLGVAAAVLAAVMPLSSANADGKITIGLGSEPTSIDPHFHNLGPNNQIAQHIFSRLVEQDEKQRLSPGLAESWKAINETTWEFKRQHIQMRVQVSNCTRTVVARNTKRSTIIRSR